MTSLPKRCGHGVAAIEAGASESPQKLRAINSCDPIPVERTDLLVQTEGDLEAVVIAETFDLLASIVGPYMYEVSGPTGEQQAIFSSREVQALFYVRVHEFLATASLPAIGSAPHNISLLTGGLWLAERYPDEANRAGMDGAYKSAAAWFGTKHRVVFWAPSVWRHLRLEVPMNTLVRMRSNMEKHHLLRLDTEIRGLQKKCIAAGCTLSIVDAVAAREELENHVREMLEYHATEVAEHLARCFLAFFHFLRNRFVLNPTNNLDYIRSPEGVTDDVFRYMYASAVVGLSGWSEDRIVGSLPETARSFKEPYPQHADWEIVEIEARGT